MSANPAAALLARYREVRGRTERLAQPLSPEDQGLQSMPECSPVKWHRAHTTWFFEQFVLGPRGVPPFEPAYGFLFNSYYEAVGPRHARPRRGLLSRPTCAEVARWRAVVDGRMAELLGAATSPELEALAPLVELGLAHEEQHQELLLTDVLHAFSLNPLRPACFATDAPRPEPPPPGPPRFLEHPGGLVEIGAPETGFAFDNERPRHRVWLEPFALADRLVTVEALLGFIHDGGYRTPALWLSAGWDQVQATRAEAPLHGRCEGGAYVTFGLGGERAADPREPALHLSYYEADALARYLGARLPTEAEWEAAATGATAPALGQLYGTAWQWTGSSHAPYPGYAPAAGALGEYNGKFMCDQQVLRGGSLATAPGHARATGRNFWPAATGFQLTGLRLAGRLS